MRISNILRTLMVLVAIPFAAARAQERVTVSADNAKLFAQPSFSGVGTAVARGTTLTVLERTGDWLAVFDGHKQAFVHRAMVSPAAPAAAEPVAQVQPQPMPAQPPASAYPQTYPQGYPGAVHPGTYAKPGQVRFPGMPGYKDPTVARVIGLLVPGGEGFYTGNMTRGIVKAALGYGGLFVLPSIVANKEVSDCTGDIYSGNYDTSSCDGTSIAWAAWAGWGTYMAMVLHGVITGDDAADAANRRPMYGMTPILQPGGNGRTMVGLRVAVPTTFGH